MSFDRLTMPIGEAMSTQRSVRKLKVMDRFHAMFAIPKEMTFHFCIPLRYPAVKYGPSRRKPIAETTSWNRWASPVPWA
jgi:hypothetical protein